MLGAIIETVSPFLIFIFFRAEAKILQRVKVSFHVKLLFSVIIDLLIDSTNFVDLYLIAVDTEGVRFKLEAGKTFMLGNAEFNASQYGDYVVDGYVDETYYSTFTNFDTIKAKANTSDIQLEYFVASS